MDRRRATRTTSSRARRGSSPGTGTTSTSSSRPRRSRKEGDLAPLSLSFAFLARGLFAAPLLHGVGLRNLPCPAGTRSRRSFFPHPLLVFFAYSSSPRTLTIPRLPPATRKLSAELAYGERLCARDRSEPLVALDFPRPLPKKRWSFVGTSSPPSLAFPYHPPSSSRRPYHSFHDMQCLSSRNLLPLSSCRSRARPSLWRTLARLPGTTRSRRPLDVIDCELVLHKQGYAHAKSFRRTIGSERSLESYGRADGANNECSTPAPLRLDHKLRGKV